MNACEPNRHDNIKAFLDSIRLLATIEGESSHVEQAIALFRRYIDVANSQLAPGSELAMASYNFGAYMAEHALQDEGVASMLRAADIAASSLGAGSFEEGIALYGAANVFGKVGDFVKAESYGRRALAILRTHRDKHAEDQILCMFQLATSCHSQEKLAEAKSLYQETIEVWRTLGEPKLDVMLGALGGYGLLESQEGRLPHAKELLDRAMEIADETLGPADPIRALLYNHQAVYYDSARDVENARLMYENALGVWALAGWPNHPHVLIAFKNYVTLLQSQKRFVELESILPRAIEKSREILGKNSRDEAIHLNDLGVAVEAQGRVIEAIGHFESALAVWEVLDWPMDDGVNVLHTNLLICALKNEEFSVALSAAESALAYTRRHYGNHHPALVERLNNFGVIYREWRKFDQAEDYFEQALRMIRSTMGSKHPELPIVLSNYARLRREQGREQAARELEEKATRAKRRLRRKMRKRK